MECKIVVGANYGDEGKGLVTRLLSKEALNNGKSCLNVLYNGGCQRGHTVDYSSDYRHVYHHFGCGILDGADTYFNKDFIVNPVTFCMEYDDLYLDKKIYAHPDCRVSTPWDMMLNQMIEKNRHENRHGSVGMGIYETIQRYKNNQGSKTLAEMMKLTDEELYYYCASISKQYMAQRVRDLEIEPEIIAEFMDNIISRNTILNFIDDFRRMCSVLCLYKLNTIVTKYDLILFEGGQGLALDENNTSNYPYLTPSSTGSSKVVQEVSNYVKDIEVCYVSRTYFTRHGAGPFPTECTKNEINPEIVDLTNVPNEFQESIRYGRFDATELLLRVNSDSSNVKRSLYLTHNNYHRLNFEEIECLKNNFNEITFIEDKYANTTITKFLVAGEL